MISNLGRAKQPFGYLDTFAKREIRRAALKAVAIPGYQVPYSSREMPMARGFGTGGLQLTLSIIGAHDVLKVIDQGSDASVNAVNIRKFIAKTCPGVRTTTRTQEASLIQSRHRIPEQVLNEKQLLVLQVPYPDALVVVEPNESRRKQMHGEADYARLWVKLYEDIVRFREITISHRYPTRIGNHYVIDPSPIPRYDVPKLHRAKHLTLFGAGREKKIYAVPPHTDACPLAFEDHPFRIEDFSDAQGQRIVCGLCESAETFLEKSYAADGQPHWHCSDTDACEQRQEAQRVNQGATIHAPA